MEFEDFFKKFCEQFENDEAENIKPDGDFRQLWSWDSLTGMAVLTMISDNYNVVIPVDEFKKLNTPKELFQAVSSKKIN